MASAPQARSDTALRNEEPRLDEMKMVDGSVTPLMHLEPEIFLDQAYAMLSILEGGFRDAATVGADGIMIKGCKFYSNLGNLNQAIIAEALEGVKSLIALAAHSVKIMDHLREKARMGQ